MSIYTNTNCIVAAAGKSKRFKGKEHKLFTKLGKYPVLFYSLFSLSTHELVNKIVVVTSKKLYNKCEELIRKYNIKKVEKIVIGGETRQESVYRGLCVLPNDTELVVIHDAARPILDKVLLKKVITAARKYDAAILGVTPKETIKLVDNNTINTLDREKLIISQTPQVFKYKLLLKAHQKAIEDNFTSTDDAQLVERIGYNIKVVPGSYNNIKLTTYDDLIVANKIIAKLF